MKRINLSPVMSGKSKTILQIFVLSMTLFYCACGSSAISEKNASANQNSATNSAKQNSADPLPTTDAAEKTKIEEALKKEGFKDLTVDYSTQPPTLRGSVAPEKIAIAILVAEKAAGKKLTNGLNEK